LAGKEKLWKEPSECKTKITLKHVIVLMSRGVAGILIMENCKKYYASSSDS
jgi:DUF2075 family protein